MYFFHDNRNNRIGKYAIAWHLVVTDCFTAPNAMVCSQAERKCYLFFLNPITKGRFAMTIPRQIGRGSRQAGAKRLPDCSPIKLPVLVIANSANMNKGTNHKTEIPPKK